MKFSKSLLVLAASTAMASGYNELFANDKEELFTDRSLALNSVGHDEARIATLTPADWKGATEAPQKNPEPPVKTAAAKATAIKAPATKSSAKKVAEPKAPEEKSTEDSSESTEAGE